MLVAILCIMIFMLLFNMALVGHLSSIERILKSLAEAKIAELKMFNGK